MDERANQILLFESQFVVKEVREIKEDKLGGKLKILASYSKIFLAAACQT